MARAEGRFRRPDGERRADAGFAFGLGAGYRFSPWVRADVTVEPPRPGSDVTLFSGGPAPAARGQADLSTTAALANVYLDLGTWYGFTPYVGAGAGYAWTRLDSYAVTGCGAPCPSGGVDLAAPTASIGHTQGDFAYALMAGVSVDAGRSLSVDLGYRYLSLGEGADRLSRRNRRSRPAGSTRTRRGSASAGASVAPRVRPRSRGVVLTPSDRQPIVKVNAR